MSQIVVTVNAGSSSVRLAAFAGAGLDRLAEERHEQGASAGSHPIREFLASHHIAPPMVVAHRVVHGGPSLGSSCLIDRRVAAEIERLTALAPLHNAAALHWIRAVEEDLGSEIPQIAVFDTGFYARLPAVASTYALPQKLTKTYGIRRFGFHGLAHRAMLDFWQAHEPAPPPAARVISIQLGAGCSITATRSGEPVDTSMGFSPLEGLVMATRSGDIDPGLLLYLMRAAGMAVDDLDRLLNQQSGLLGLSDRSADMRVLLASNDAGARLAIDIYCHRARKYVGAYLAVLGGADAILFGGGVGENSPEIRARILSGLEFAGVRLDTQRNLGCVGTGGNIGAGDSAIGIWVAPVDEARVLAREAFALMPPQAERDANSGPAMR